MFERIAAFFRGLNGEADKDADRTFPRDDPRLAAAALMYHIIGADGVIREAEKTRFASVLRETYALDTKTLDKLIAAARDADNEAVDLYQFTSVLMRSLGADERVHFIELLWEIVYADGENARTGRQYSSGVSPNCSASTAAIACFCARPAQATPHGNRRSRIMTQGLDRDPDPDRASSGDLVARGASASILRTGLCARHPPPAARRPPARNARRPRRRGGVRRADERQRRGRVSSAARPTGWRSR